MLPAVNRYTSLPSFLDDFFDCELFPGFTKRDTSERLDFAANVVEEADLYRVEVTESGLLKASLTID